MSIKPYIIGALLMFICITIRAETLAIGDKVPDWTLNKADGSQISLYTDAGDKPVVLLFWATWCPYCQALMPELESLKQSLGNKYQFYALNIFENADPVAHMKKHNFSFTLLLNADPVAENYGVKGTPGVIVVGPDKTVRYTRKSGSKPNVVRAQIEAALKNKH